MKIDFRKKINKWVAIAIVFVILDLVVVNLCSVFSSFVDLSVSDDGFASIALNHSVKYEPPLCYGKEKITSPNGKFVISSLYDCKELWIKDVDKNQERFLVGYGDMSQYFFARSELKYKFLNSSTLVSPVFSSDSRKLYFEEYGGSERDEDKGIFSIDVLTTELNLISLGHSFCLISRGEYKNDITVIKMRYSENVRHYDSYIFDGQNYKLLNIEKDINPLDYSNCNKD